MHRSDVRQVNALSKRKSIYANSILGRIWRLARAKPSPDYGSLPYQPKKVGGQRLNTIRSIIHQQLFAGENN